MEEEIGFSVWESLLESGGQAVTAVALATNTYLKVKKSITGASPLENALSTQLPMALDRTGLSVFSLHQNVSDTVNHHCPMGKIKEEMHTGKLSKQEKITLWGQLFKGSVGLMLLTPYLAAAESACLALRSVSCVLIHHEMEGKGKGGPAGSGLFGGGGGGATDALLNSMMMKMLNTVGTTPFLEQITPESDEAISTHMERVVAPSVIRMAFDAVDKFFIEGEWVLTEPVTHEKFMACFSKARAQFEKDLQWDELFHAMNPLLQHQQHQQSGSASIQMTDDGGDAEGAAEEATTSSSGASSPDPKEVREPETTAAITDAAEDDEEEEADVATSSPPTAKVSGHTAVGVGPTAEEQRDSADYQQRTKLRSYMTELLASPSFEDLVLDFSDRALSATTAQLQGSYASCKSYNQEQRTALLLHVVLHVEKHANAAADKAPELSKLTKKFCSELLKSSM